MTYFNGTVINLRRNLRIVGLINDMTGVVRFIIVVGYTLALTLENDGINKRIK